MCSLSPCLVTVTVWRAICGAKTWWLVLLFRPNLYSEATSWCQLTFILSHWQWDWNIKSEIKSAHWRFPVPTCVKIYTYTVSIYATVADSNKRPYGVCLVIYKVTTGKTPQPHGRFRDPYGHVAIMVEPEWSHATLSCHCHSQPQAPFG